MRVHVPPARSIAVFLAGALGALALGLAAPDAARAELDKDTQKCINEINKQLSKLAKAQAKDNAKCVKNATKGKVEKLGIPATAEDCLTNDVKGKIAKTSVKLAAKLADKCPATPPFANDDPNQLIDIAITKELALVHAIFGSDLDESLVVLDKASDKDPNDPTNTKVEGKCQTDVYKAVTKCQVAKFKAFIKCKKEGLKDEVSPVEDAAALQARCLESLDPASTGGALFGGIPDPKNKLNKACQSKMFSKIRKKCEDPGVLGTGLFPGCNDPNAQLPSHALNDCLDRIVDCQVCNAINAADGTERDCDNFDDGLANGSCGAAKLVFVTSEIFLGELGGLSGADVECQALADDAALGGTYKAWLAVDGGDSPSSTFTQSSGPYRLVDGTLIADDWADLTDGTLQNPINKTETGAGPPETRVWTNVATDGSPASANDCDGWDTLLAPLDLGNYGNPGATNSNWTAEATLQCSLFHPLYCFEQ